MQDAAPTRRLCRARGALGRSALAVRDARAVLSRSHLLSWHKVAGEGTGRDVYAPLAGHLQTVSSFSPDTARPARRGTFCVAWSG